MNDNLNGQYAAYVNPREKDGFIANLQEVADWMDNDGDDKTKDVYTAKLNDLKMTGDPIKERYTEDQLRRRTVLKACVNLGLLKEMTMSADVKYGHIEVSEKQKAFRACEAALAWLAEKEQQQNALPKYANLAFRIRDVTAKTEEAAMTMTPYFIKGLEEKRKLEAEMKRKVEEEKEREIEQEKKKQMEVEKIKKQNEEEERALQQEEEREMLEGRKSKSARSIARKKAKKNSLKIQTAERLEAQDKKEETSSVRVVGFDFGNQSCVVAVARQRGIDVVVNDESNRETPSIVSFGEKQRFFGGAASALMNQKNTISQIKRLIGHLFSDPELQRDLKTVPFTVTEGPDGYPLIHARYLGEPKTFTPTQVLGMLFSNLKGIAEKNLNAAVVDCCIRVPVYFTDLQRRSILDAAAIAGLHSLRLVHETTATALAYGIYKTDLPENAAINVAFVDVGHSSFQVCIAALEKGQLKILSHSFDRSLGGRDFDEALFEHFAAKFKDEYKIDVYKNASACLRLRTSCEKLKQVLSENPEAPLNIECLMEEKDVRGHIKRDEFEKICIPILERVDRSLEKALTEAGLTTEDIHTVEVVGSGSKVPAIINIMSKFFGKEPQRTMNASECVAKGCAIFGPIVKLEGFQVDESFPFSISMSWNGLAAEAQNGETEGQQSTIVIRKRTAIPSLKSVTIRGSGTLAVELSYADGSELQARAEISKYTIGPFESTNADRAQLKVRVRLNDHGVVSIERVWLLEVFEVEVPVDKDAMTINPDPSSGEILSETDVTVQDSKNDGPKAVQMDTDVKRRS